ncbi:Hpt domain-containing protein [Roseiconus nitratireducens]|uniref:Hpt domain-containing protein n=1 Tax=Roseiconus nitratireducens TaxID=2605748 RepID=UPI001375F70A|nr:Hpt domain-containing protein [Roseiconus nitratireducens]
MAIPLVVVVAGTLVVSHQAGLVPQSRRASHEYRHELSKTIAIGGAAMLVSERPDAFAAASREWVARHPDLKSVGLVSPDGAKIFETSNHSAVWERSRNVPGSALTTTLSADGKSYGTLQLAFAPLPPAWSDLNRLLLFVCPTCFLMFAFLIPGLLRRDRRDNLEPVAGRQDTSTATVSAGNQGRTTGDAAADRPSVASPTSEAAPDLPNRHLLLDLMVSLDTRLKDIRLAVDNADFKSLRTEARSLRGLGQASGVDALFAPAEALERAALRADTRGATEMLRQIDDLIEQISTAAALEFDSQTSGPIACSLPLDDDDYREIVNEFIEQFDRRLMLMLSHVEQGAFEPLEQEAHWLKGCGGTVGYEALTKPAIELMHSARAKDHLACQRALGAVLDIRKRLVVPITPNGHSKTQAKTESLRQSTGKN